MREGSLHEEKLKLGKHSAEPLEVGVAETSCCGQQRRFFYSSPK